ncbi:hypothetical protein ACT6QH_09285 [Xanthobacter sp. TB0139]|uniref:hypothetical protein n=1 Tax=Xanthobacter sp. TB0139 TaxID=3459178 RepID=UPI00403A04E3
MTDPDSPAAPGQSVPASGPRSKSRNTGRKNTKSSTKGPNETSTGRNAPRQSKLGGVLAVIFWCACGITALPIAGLFTLIMANGFSGLIWAVKEIFAGVTLSAQVLRLGLIPQVFLFVWGLSTVVLTVARLRQSLLAIPALLGLWVVISILCQIGIRNLMSANGAGISDIATLLPGILMQIAATAGLYGYFREAERPRLFYTR